MTTSVTSSNRKTTKNTAAKSTKEKSAVYIGPSFPKGELSQYTIFSNGLPGFLMEHSKKCVALKSLVIPVERLGEAQQKLMVKGSAERTLYDTAEAYIRGGEK